MGSKVAPIVKLVDGNGVLHLKELTNIVVAERKRCGAADDSEQKVGIVAVTGAQKSGCSSLINRLVGTTFESAGPVRGTQLSLGLAAQFAPSAPNGVNSVLVLDAEGFDHFEMQRVIVQDQVSCLGALLADVIVTNVMFHDLSRGDSSGIIAISSFARALCSHQNKLPVQRKKLIVVVRDFESDQCDIADVVEAYSSELNAHLSSTCSGKRAADLFDLEFELLPSAFIDSSGFSHGTAHLSSVVNAAISERAAFASKLDASELRTRVSSFWGHSADGVPADSPSSGTLSEAQAAHACEHARASAIGFYHEKVREWKALAHSGTGRIIRNFGTECNARVDEVLAKYDEAGARECSGSETYKRKKEELLSAVILDLQTLYSIQVNNVRDIAFHVFKERLGRIRMNSQVEKALETATNEAQTFFVNRASGLRCQYAKPSAWRYDSELKELQNAMRENATERLQLARLRGSYIPKLRNPVAFSVHWLNPSPFGLRDSRFEMPTPLPVATRPDPDSSRRAAPSVFKHEQQAGGRQGLRSLSHSDFEEMLEMMQIIPESEDVDSSEEQDD